MFFSHCSGEEYAKRFQQSISFNLGLEKQLENAELQTAYVTSHLQSQCGMRHGIYLFSFFLGFGCQQLTFCSTFCTIVVCFFPTQELLEHQQSFQPHAVLHAQDISGYHPLRSQFKQAATLISARVDRQAERDFFFIEDGGWDSHKGVENALYTKWLAGNS